jgi:hypothetical protein
MWVGWSIGPFVLLVLMADGLAQHFGRGSVFSDTFTRGAANVATSP